ncbi:hypothetical protein [Streptomyces sp. NPDC048106]|uniref:hypothetical protein n=1 Tax=Streptomyces sp. NPDC048106 TaxID=3155750 RepID=UPI0034561FE7
MIRRVRFGRVGAVAAAVVVLGAPVARADAGTPSATGARTLQVKAPGDADRLTIDRLGRDGGETLKVGSTLKVRAGFTYHGKRALRQVMVYLFTSEGLPFTTEYGNCHYGSKVRQGSEQTSSRALCRIDVRVEPGESVDLAPISLKVGEHALTERVSVGDATGMDWSGGEWPDVHRGRGEPLTLARRTGSVPPADRQTDGMESGMLTVSVDNTWDMAVTGAALRGRKGETLTAGLALDFHGADLQAQLDAENSVPFARVEVKFPKGVTVLNIPKDCKRGDVRSRPPYYLCEYGLYTNGFDIPLLRDGFHRDYPFKVRIDDTSRLTGGTVRVDAPEERLRADADPGNSTAPITFEAVGGAADGAGGSGTTAWVVAGSAAAVALAGLLAVALVRRRAR